MTYCQVKGKSKPTGGRWTGTKEVRQANSKVGSGSASPLVCGGTWAWDGFHISTRLHWERGRALPVWFIFLTTWFPVHRRGDWVCVTCLRESFERDWKRTGSHLLTLTKQTLMWLWTACARVVLAAGSKEMGFSPTAARSWILPSTSKLSWAFWVSHSNHDLVQASLHFSLMRTRVENWLTL